MPPDVSSRNLSGLEDPFRGKPSKRLVWLFPSVILHVIAGVVWYCSPEDAPREIKERRMVIKQEQAKKLQDFVENANLQELRNEVARLQEIKQAMDVLRGQQMRSLEHFEVQLREASVDIDSSELLEAMSETQEAFIQTQDQLIEKMQQLDRVYQAMSPLVVSESVAQLVPYAAQALELRRSLLVDQEIADQQFQILQARIDEADGVMSWSKSKDLTAQWEAYVLDQQNAFKLHRAAMDEQNRLKLTQEGALSRIVSEGATYVEQVQTSIRSEATAKQDYEQQKKSYEDQLASGLHKDENLQQELDTQAMAIKELRAERGRLSKLLASVQAKDKERRAEVLAEIRKVDVDLKSMSNQRQVDQRAHNDHRRSVNQVRQNLNRLRAPTPLNAKVRERMIESMGRSLSALSGQVGDLELQQKARVLQAQLLQQNCELIHALQKSEGSVQ